MVKLDFSDKVWRKINRLVIISQCAKTNYDI